MKLIVQRVKYASVTIDGKVHGKIDQGYMILVGIQNEDTREIVEKMANKIAKLRIFTDEEDKMNLDLHQVNGSILSISQFTLYAFSHAGKPDIAKPLYLYFNDCLRKDGFCVEEGIFGADMKVELLNDGPVTIILDSDVDIRH